MRLPYFDHFQVGYIYILIVPCCNSARNHFTYISPPWAILFLSWRVPCTLCTCFLTLPESPQRGAPEAARLPPAANAPLPFSGQLHHWVLESREEGSDPPIFPWNQLPPHLAGQDPGNNSINTGQQLNNWPAGLGERGGKGKEKRERNSTSKNDSHGSKDSQTACYLLPGGDLQGPSGAEAV